VANTKLGIEIVTDNAKAIKGLKQVEQGLKGVGDQSKKTERSSSGLRDVLGGLAIGAGLKVAIGEFEEAEKTARQTEAVIKSTGNAAEISAAQQDKMVDSLSRLAAVDDEVVAGGANIIRTFTSIKGEAFEPTLAAALDMSAALGTDLKSSAMAVGKALNDPAAGLTKLTRMGVTFTAQQKEQVKALQASGDTLGAQKIILAELEKEFGGTAEANVTSSAKMKVAFGNAAESVGGVLAPAMEKGAQAAELAAKAFDALPGPMQTAAVAGAALVYVGPKIADGFGKVRKAATELKTGTEGAEVGASKLGVALGAIAVVGTAASIYEMSKAANEFSFNAEAAAKATDEQLLKAARDLATLDPNTFKNLDLTTLYRMRDVLAANGQVIPGVTAAIKELEAAEKRGATTKATYGAEVEKNTAASVEAKDAFKGLADATTDVGDRMGETNRILGEQAEVLREAEQETRDLTSAALDAFSADLGYQDSLRRTTEATRALTEARRAGDPTALAEAERSLNEAIARQVEQKLALATAEAEANGKQLTAAQSALIQRDALDEARKSTGYWNADLEVLRQRLDNAANSAASAAAQIAALAIQQSVAGLGDAFSGAFGIKRRAAGGSLREGEAAVVGDGGRSELFVAPADGVILPDAKAALAGAGSTTVNVNVQGVTDLSAAGDIIGARVARSLRLVRAA
jgi:hypothetical protein